MAARTILDILPPSAINILMTQVGQLQQLLLLQVRTPALLPTPSTQVHDHACMWGGGVRIYSPDGVRSWESTAP
jgi:hypothetical protein